MVDKLELPKGFPDDCHPFGPSRMSGKAVLEERIRQIREKADSLEVLLRELPESLSYEADEALWKLVLDIHH